MSRFRIVRGLAAVLISAGALYPQGELATVTGEVTDAASGIMSGVTITVRNVDTNIKRSIETNAEGYFTITSLTPGAYELTAEKQGFRAHHETGIILATGQELRIPIKMSVGAVSESVSVTAEVAPLNTENGMIKGAVITQSEVNDMPLNGRDFTELALFVPGVVTSAAGGAGAMAINGARADTEQHLRPVDVAGLVLHRPADPPVAGAPDALAVLADDVVGDLVHGPRAGVVERDEVVQPRVHAVEHRVRVVGPHVGGEHGTEQVPVAGVDRQGIRVLQPHGLQGDHAQTAGRHRTSRYGRMRTQPAAGSLRMAEPTGPYALRADSM